MNKRAVITYIFVLATGLAAGCAQRATPGALSPSEAHQKLVNILKEENNLRIITKEFRHTLWIYLPFEKSFLGMKAKKEQPAGPSSAPTTSPAIYFLEGEFNGQDFVIQYDISSSKKYAKDYGYTSAFTEEYQADQRNILTAISRAYTGVENPPDFFVLVMADIVNGLEARLLLHLNDLKRAYTDQTFHGEYAKRVISDQPSGSPKIIGDKAGRHVDFHDIRLPEFLVKQMIFRINFKYTRSAFPPTDTPKEEILKAAAETVDAYDFTEFGFIELQDLSDGAIYTIEREELAEYGVEPSEGRLIHIQFR